MLLSTKGVKLRAYTLFTQMGFLLQRPKSDSAIFFLHKKYPFWK